MSFPTGLFSTAGALKPVCTKRRQGEAWRFFESMLEAGRSLCGGVRYTVSVVGMLPAALILRVSLAGVAFDFFQFDLDGLGADQNLVQRKEERHNQQKNTGAEDVACRSRLFDE